MRKARTPRSIPKTLGIFYLALAVAWFATEYREPKEEAPKVTRRGLPVKKPYAFPADYSESHKKLAGVFAEATEMFSGGNVPVLLLPPFTLSTGDGSPALLTYVTESAYDYLYNDRKVRVVRRDYDSGGKSRIRGRYILIGKVGTLGEQVRITVRIQDVNTGEILDSFDNYLSRAQVGRYL